MKLAHRMLSALFAVMLFASLAVVLPACNTVKGAGDDIKAVGEAGEKVISGDDD